VKAFLFAYRANIDRYQRILESHLTPEELRFVESRLAAEQAALERIESTISPISAKDRVVPRTLPQVALSHTKAVSFQFSSGTETGPRSPCGPKQTSVCTTAICLLMAAKRTWK
jgi:hypothetical protein